MLGVPGYRDGSVDIRGWEATEGREGVVIFYLLGECEENLDSVE